MPQSWDMGQILSLPLRRKACGGFFRWPKNHRLRPGLNPQTTRPPKSAKTCYTFISFVKRPSSTDLRCKRNQAPYSGSGQTADRGQLFRWSRSLFGLYRNLLTATIPPIALRLTAFFFWINLPLEETLNHMKTLKSKCRSLLTDELSEYCIQLCLRNHGPCFGSYRELFSAMHQFRNKSIKEKTF